MNAPGAVLAAGLATLAIGAAVDLTGGARWPRLRAVPFLAGAGGAGCLAVAGAAAVAGHQARLGAGGWLGAGTSGLVADQLSGLFLLITFAAAVPVSLACAGWAARPGAVGRRGLGASYALTLGAVAMVMTAADAFTLLLAWELLTVAFYLLAGFERGRPGRPGAAVVTLAFGKVSGAALLVGLLLLAVRSGSLELASFAAVPGGVARDTAQTLLVIGFAVKVGLVPFQVWLPRGYAAAPGPVRAIMAGVAVNVGFYGMWRTLQILGAPPVWLVVAVLLVAGITAVLGIAHAAVHADLRYVVAWSSVENAGVITAGYAAALVGAAGGEPLLLAAGLLAATMQVIAHALGKSLLFVATAAVEQATGTTDLDRLRGVVWRLPWAGTGLVVGCMTLAGLPLTAGFAAEWLTLEALMQQFRIHSLPMQLSMAAAGALVALTVGVAGFTFVRIVGLTAFGHPPVPAPVPADNPDRRWSHRLGVAVLTAGCLGLAVLAPLEVRVIAAALTPLVGTDTDRALASPWVLQPVYGEFSALSPTWLWIVIPALTVITGIGAAALSGKRLWRVRTVPAWSSASPGVDRGVGYTSFGYANPVRKVLANLLQTRGQLHRTTATPEIGGAGADGTAGGAGVDAEQDHTAAPVQLGYTVDVVEVVEKYLYHPLAAAVLRLARLAKRLQSGRLDAYMAYMLIAVIAVLAVVTAIT